MHMYNSHEGRVLRSIRCTSRCINVYMTHPMYLSGCQGVAPHPDVIDMVTMK